MTGYLQLEPVEGASPDLGSALEAAKLPTDDLTEGDRFFFRVVERDRDVGFGGYELHGENALLRSVVILPGSRGVGSGRDATILILKRAFEQGATSAYLLTETAAPFFAKLGFEPIERADAPGEIRCTRQAAALCPSSAVMMVKRLPA